MDSYSVNFKPSVQKDLRPLPKALVARVMERIEGLKTDPFPRQAIKLSVLNGFIAFEWATIGSYTRLTPRPNRS
jgi:mRNA-degrading endonuclease RelE of RelBE toxin-antitoxin system